MRTFEYFVRDHDLPQDARCLQFVGSPRTLVWPNICPSCGSPASERIPVRKIFRRIEGAPNDAFIRHLITRVDIPFCAECAERHRQSLEPAKRFELLLLFTLFRTGLFIPLAGAVIFAAIFFRPALVATRGDASSGLMGLALFGCFILAAVASVVVASREVRFLRVPRQTEITRACGFSDNLGNFVVGERRAYAIRNAAFAEALVAANRERVWTAADKVRSGRIWMAITAIAIGLLVCASLLGVLQ